VTALALTGIALALDVPAPTAAVAGFGLAMSSTAFVLQMLAERNARPTRHGRAAFAILLFQDLSVLPFLALIPMLAGGDGGFSATASAWALAVIVLLMAGGRYALRPLLRLLADSGVPEIFTAAALLGALVQPPELQYPRRVELPPHLEDYRATLLKHPATQWAANIYRLHRGRSAEVSRRAAAA
jgi:Kef-type K+ transport system membrane component KefB